MGIVEKQLPICGCIIHMDLRYYSRVLNTRVGPIYSVSRREIFLKINKSVGQNKSVGRIFSEFY